MLLKKQYNTWVSEGRKDLTADELDTIFEEAECSQSTEASTPNQDQTLQPRASIQAACATPLQTLQTISHAACWVAGWIWNALGLTLNNTFKSRISINIYLMNSQFLKLLEVQQRKFEI